MHTISTSRAFENLDQIKDLITHLSNEKHLNDPIGVDDIGDSIKTMRKAKGITQADFADLCGVSKNVLAAVESGRHTVSLANFLKVINMFGLTISAHDQRRDFS